MWGSKKPKKQGRVASLIGQGTEIVGDINFKGWLHIDGCVRGNILAPEDELANLTISEYGLVEGEIRIPHVVINGTVEGNVYSTAHLKLEKKAQVHGNVYYQRVEMANGAEVNGSLGHIKAEQPAAIESKENLDDADDVVKVEAIDDEIDEAQIAETEEKNTMSK